LRVYHNGRDSAHRARDRGLHAAGIDVTLVVPRNWPETDEVSVREPFPVVELPVARPGDVNRHAYFADGGPEKLIGEVAPDLLDVHEEPFSLAAHQWLDAVPPALPVVMYTAQNIDKRFPPPFHLYERRAFGRVDALYPCSHQAASVARGKGFPGIIDVLPLGYDADQFAAGRQSVGDDEIVLALVGRLVPEKGVLDAVRVLADVRRIRPAKLIVVGAGPEEGRARDFAASLGVASALEIQAWRSAAELGEIYRAAHLVLVPSVATATWTEQFGRVIVEAQASGAVVAGYVSGAIPEVVGDAGILAPPGDTSHLAREVVQVAGDPDRYSLLRERGFELSRTRTWAEVAARQVDLYRRVLESNVARLDLPASPRRRRERARAEFGLPAETPAGLRPFALPGLRQGGPVAGFLGGVIEAGAELRATVVSRLRS
jgi:glycosyltransferase involved in cell wall biosynthesis